MFNTIPLEVSGLFIYIGFLGLAPLDNFLAENPKSYNEFIRILRELNIFISNIYNKYKWTPTIHFSLYEIVHELYVQESPPIMYPQKEEGRVHFAWVVWVDSEEG